MIALASALLLAAAPAPPRCALERLEACDSANTLMFDRRFGAAMHSFFGKRRGSYLGEDLPLVDQATQSLIAPLGEPKRLANGNWLFTGCRPHSCVEKGGVVLSPGGRVIAMAMLNYHCHKVPSGQSPCENGPTLDMFVDHMAGSAGDQNLVALKAWGQAAADADRANDGYGLTAPFQGVELRGLRDEEEDDRRRPAKRPRTRR